MQKKTEDNIYLSNHFEIPKSFVEKIGNLSRGEIIIFLIICRFTNGELKNEVYINSSKLKFHNLEGKKIPGILESLSKLGWIKYNNVSPNVFSCSLNYIE